MCKGVVSQRSCFRCGLAPRETRFRLNAGFLPQSHARMKRPFLPSLEALAVCAVMASVVAALSVTLRQLVRTHNSRTAIAQAIREQPQHVARRLAGVTNQPLEAELQCFACTNGPATNESPRI